MNYLSSFKQLSRSKQIAVLLIVSTFTWAVGVPTFFATASAAQLASVSMTASSSVPGALGNFTLRFTSTTTAASLSTMTIQFSVGNSGGASNEYDLSSLVAGDMTSSGMTIVTVCTGAASELLFGSVSNSAGNRTVNFTVCTGDTIAAGAKVVYFNNNHVQNPTTLQSYRITVGGNFGDTGTAMTAIVNQVTVTAAVDTTLTFTVSAVASGQRVNNEAVSTTSTASAIGFGVLASGTPVVAAQDLTVATNAQNGFIVTVHEDQNLLSANGADIDLFSDGTAVATPAAWATPTAQLGIEGTYGHIGITSDDTDLNANEFFSGSVIKWAGNFYPTTTRTIFSHTGPADGVTQNIGRARVGYKILVSNLQEAATDYTNHLIYVCTPTF